MAASDVTDSLTLANALRGGGSPSFFSPGMKLAGQMAVPWAGASLLASGLGLKGPLSMGGRTGGSMAGADLFFGQNEFDREAGAYASKGGQHGSGPQTVSELQGISDTLYSDLNERMLAEGIDPSTIPFNVKLRLFSELGTGMTSPFSANFGNNYFNQRVGKGYTIGPGQYADRDSLLSSFADDFMEQARLAPEDRMRSLDQFQSDRPHAPENRYQQSATTVFNDRRALDEKRRIERAAAIEAGMLKRRTPNTNITQPVANVNIPQIPSGQAVPPQPNAATQPVIQPTPSTATPTGGAPAGTPIPTQPGGSPTPQQWAGPATQHHTPMKRNYWMGNKITNPQQWNWRQPNPNQLANGLRA